MRAFLNLLPRRGMEFRATLCGCLSPRTDANGCARVPGGKAAPVDGLQVLVEENGMDRAQKPIVVEELNRVFNEVNVVVVTRNLGLTVAQSTALRNKMREGGATYKVTKNSLAKIAAKGTVYESISDLLTGPVALASSIDPVAAAKVVVEFAKTNDKLEIVGGAMGTTALDVDGVKALATMPSLDELRAKIVGLVQAPATKVVQIVQAPAGQLARVFGAYGAKEAA